MYSVVLMMALSGSAATPAGHGCNGCWGGNGCHGWSGHGCNGCHGGWFRGRHGCNGCNGCHGGCMGYACHGGCVGGACHGGCMGYACHGGHGCVGGVVPVAPAPEMKKEMPTPEPIKEPKKATEEAAVPAPATIIVNLPADAKLAIDDFVTTSTSSPRYFATPTLARGKDFTYMLKAEIQRDGRTLTTTQMVTVRAGEESRVELQFPVASVAQK